MVRPESATAVALVLMGCLATPGCAAAESPREMAVRGMGMITEEGATEQRQYDGWQLVARAIGDAMDAQDLWRLDDEAMRDGICAFLGECADEAEFPQYEDSRDAEPLWFDPTLGRSTMIKWPKLHACRDPDTDEPTAVLLRFRAQRPWSPNLPMAWALIGRAEGRSIAGAWRQYIGRGRRDPAGVGGWDGDCLAWRDGDWLRVLFAGGWFTGGSGGALFPLGGLLESAHDRWRLVDWCVRDPEPHFRRHADIAADIDYRYVAGHIGLEDLDRDGIPEIVGHHEYPSSAAGEKCPWRDYFVHKVINGRLRQVWYAKLEKPRNAVLRFLEAIEFDCDPMARNVSLSWRAVAQARRLGLFEHAGESYHAHDFRGLTRADDQGQAQVFIGGQEHRFNLRRIGANRWRIVTIERVLFAS